MILNRLANYSPLPFDVNFLARLANPPPPPPSPSPAPIPLSPEVSAPLVTPCNLDSPLVGLSLLSAATGPAGCDDELLPLVAVGAAGVCAVGPHVDNVGEAGGGALVVAAGSPPAVSPTSILRL